MFSPTHTLAFRFRPLAHSCALIGAALLLHGGCTPDGELPEEADQVLVSLVAVPADVACLRITAEGKARTAVKLLSLSAPPAPDAGEDATTVTKALGGLPIGPVVFTGEAFDKPCDDVTASSIAGWASEPVAASLAQGRLATVSLSLVRNGRAKVKVSFTDDVATPDAGPPATSG